MEKKRSISDLSSISQISEESAKKKRGRPTKDVVFGEHLKTLLDYIQNIGKPISFDQLIKETQLSAKLDEKSLKTLFKNLKGNIKVRFEFAGSETKDEMLVMKEGKFTFKPEHEVKNKEDIIHKLSLDYYRKKGIDTKDLKDSYKNVEADIEELIKSKRVYAVKSKEGVGKMLFYKDPSYQMNVDSSLIELWKSVQDEIPIQSVNLEAQLKNVGEEPLTTIIWPDAKVPSKKKKEEKKKRKKRLEKL